MPSGYFTVHATTCQVAESLQEFNQPWESFLKQWKGKQESLIGINDVTDVSVRGWICGWENDEVKVLLGQRAKGDSSPNLFEAFGGKCDSNESILGALIREIREETGQYVLFIHALLGVDVFLTPRSKRWIAQPHFLIEVEQSSKCHSGGFKIQLDPLEHQAYVWAPGTLGALDGLQLTEATQGRFECAVTTFRESCSRNPISKHFVT